MGSEVSGGEVAHNRAKSTPPPREQGSERFGRHPRSNRRHVSRILRSRAGRAGLGPAGSGPVVSAAICRLRQRASSYPTIAAKLLATQSDDVRRQHWHTQSWAVRWTMLAKCCPSLANFATSMGNKWFVKLWPNLGNKWPKAARICRSRGEPRLLE